MVLTGVSRRTLLSLLSSVNTAYPQPRPPIALSPFSYAIMLATLSARWTENIRDVIAFPKTQNAIDPLFGAPSPVEQAQLDELKLSVTAGGD